MACKRSAVRSRLSPPNQDCRDPKSPSSRGLGHDPFTVVTGVRIPLGTPPHCAGDFMIGNLRQTLKAPVGAFSFLPALLRTSSLLRFDRDFDFIRNSFSVKRLFHWV